MPYGDPKFTVVNPSPDFDQSLRSLRVSDYLGAAAISSGSWARLRLREAHVHRVREHRHGPRHDVRVHDAPAERTRASEGVQGEREGGEGVQRVAGAAGAQGDRSGGQEVPRRHRHD